MSCTPTKASYSMGEPTDCTQRIPCMYVCMYINIYIYIQCIYIYIDRYIYMHTYYLYVYIYIYYLYMYIYIYICIYIYKYTYYHMYKYISSDQYDRAYFRGISCIVISCLGVSTVPQPGSIFNHLNRSTIINIWKPKENASRSKRQKSFMWVKQCHKPIGERLESHL